MHFPALPHEFALHPASLAILTAPATLLLAALVVLELVVLGLSERVLAVEILSDLPWRRFAYLLLAPGTILHELSHAAACVVVGSPIARIAPFAPQETPDGLVFGYVSYADTGRLPSTLVSLAPMALVPAAYAALTFALLGSVVPGDLPHAISVAGLPAALAWLLLAGLGSRGAFPSPGDHVSVLALGLIVVVLGSLAALLALLAPTGLLALLYGLALLLALPVVFDTALLLVFVGLVR